MNASYIYIRNSEALTAALKEMPTEGVMGLDTETFWDRTTNRNTLSLVQIAPPGLDVLVVDALSTGAEALREFLEGPAPLFVAHNARFDFGVLQNAGIKAAGLIDTLQLARRGLTLSSYSLASVAEHLFGLPLDKSWRMTNWRRRPLSAGQISYAALDAKITLLVYEELKNRLEGEGRFDEALRAASLGATYAAGKRRRIVKREPYMPLTREEQRIVAHLKKWRLDCASLQRVPAYMICTDKTLENLARARPESVDGLENVYGLGASKISRFGEEILAALREALK